MPDKKADESALQPEDQALEERVQAIMDPRRPDPVPTPAPPAPVAGQPPIDIFSDPRTAPTVPAKLLEKIGAKASDKKQTATDIVPEETTNEQAPTPAITPATPPSSTEQSAVIEQPDSDKLSVPLDDSSTDKAVDDIVVAEGDEVLAAEDAAKQAASKDVAAPGRPNRLGRLFANKWLWLSLLVLLGGLGAFPATRYRLLGLVLKESVSVTVTDSTTNTPVSDALLSLDGTSAKTDAIGKATLRVPPGNGTLRATKQYYKPYSTVQRVGLRSGKHLHVQLLATGRQVPITVVNRISGKPLQNAEISILDTSARTDQQGRATIVLPTKAASDSATISLNGYNASRTSVEVTSSAVSANTVSLTPAGHLYFLSNLSGTIDVVKANLDGTDRQTVLKGTGREDPNTTSLLASRDWRYLVLKAQRDASSSPSLYLIDTNTDKITQFDSGNADFTLVGWYGHYFMYDVVRPTVQNWQAGHEALKSYDADTGQLELLDQNQAEGDSSSYAYQGFLNFYTVNNLVVYNTQWYTYDADGTGYDLTGKSDTIRAIQPDGQSKRDYQSLPASGLGNTQAVLFQPQSIYYTVYNYTANTNAYYEFTDGAVSSLNSLSQTTFSQPYPTYLVSPSGTRTFWTELRDGQNALFVGDQDAQNQKQVASLNGYAPYGWFSDNYVLVSKGGSELYIMPTSGLANGQQPLKITDYYKPTQTYNGYGYGYGGL